MGNKRQDIDSEHHIIPKSRAEEGYNVFSRKNIVTIPFVTVHEPYHRLFKLRTPKEIQKFLLDIQKNVLSKVVREAIRDLLNMEVQDFYDSDIIR